MTSNRFFIRRVNPDSSFVFLEGEEHHHLSTVKRVRTKEEVWLFDEEGRTYLARVEKIEKERTKLKIIETREGKEVKVEITLAQALLKAKKMDFIIQKSVELGVMSIIPVISSRSIVKMEERGGKKLERWRKIVLEAVKQSKNPWIPSLSAPLPLGKLVKEVEAEEKLFLHEEKGAYLKNILLREMDSGKKGPPCSVLVLIGPEGGWSEEEVELILSHGFEEVSLGRNILRSETAALSSLVLISHFWNL